MSGYTRRLVEQLLPHAWDTSAVFGVRPPTAPPAGMPTGSVNLAHANTLFAHLADIHHGWRTAPLTLRERRAVFLRFHLDWDLAHIGAHEGVTKQAIDRRLYTGVGKITATLNKRAFTDATEAPDTFGNAA